MVKFLGIFLLFLSSVSVSAQAPSLQNINLGVAVDTLASGGFDRGADNQVNVRSGEILLYGPVDHIFDGVLNVAGHNHDGHFHVQLHEAYIGSSRLIPQSRFRVGKFLLNVGRLNNFHQHDWPFVTAPKVFREFFSPGGTILQAEGVADSGLEYTWLLPTKRFIDITVGVTNGYCYGECETPGQKPPYPLYYVHPTTFFDYGDGKGMLLGASYMSRKNASYQKTDLYGIDLTYKVRHGKRLKWLVQSEVFYQVQSVTDAEGTRKYGFYIYPQYGLNERLSLGFRVDGFSHLNLKDESGANQKDYDYALVPTVTYKTSEFSTVRLAYAHEVDTTAGHDNKMNRQIMLQLTFLLGAHPAHDF